LRYRPGACGFHLDGLHDGQFHAFFINGKLVPVAQVEIVTGHIGAPWERAERKPSLSHRRLWSDP
jgi:hypothetical protein